MPFDINVFVNFDVNKKRNLTLSDFYLFIHLTDQTDFNETETPIIDCSLTAVQWPQSSGPGA
ncbi:hypothetical protein D9M70_575640 [compost metagenome]